MLPGFCSGLGNAGPSSQSGLLQLTDNSKDMAFEAGEFLNILLLGLSDAFLGVISLWNKGAGGSDFGNADGPRLLPLL